MNEREAERLRQRVAHLEKLVAQLMQPKSVARLITPEFLNLYRFTLNASLATGTADADILEMDGTDTGLDEDVLDPLGIFAALTAVDSAGLCIYQDGKYYVIQAACPA